MGCKKGVPKSEEHKRKMVEERTGRKRKFATSPAHAEAIRQRIKTGKIIGRLQSHVINDDVKMSATQVNAGLGLLKKVLPDLQTTALTGEGGGPVIIEAVGDASKLV